ncbi:hypothetical protein L1987_03779 [Smallanthus sonchifolius]|uniref:Uncharacterized protein n=1 Tax=Smallanthus sonchifolius TaxID=185202 RepID=A0ACB9KBJ1_9ASTR|nr:hypothetical protein L1987_03779 [Smallanthus sonchifolius]
MDQVLRMLDRASHDPNLPVPVVPLQRNTPLQGNNTSCSADVAISVILGNIDFTLEDTSYIVIIRSCNLGMTVNMKSLKRDVNGGGIARKRRKRELETKNY